MSVRDEILHRKPYVIDITLNGGPKMYARRVSLELGEMLNKKWREATTDPEQMAVALDWIIAAVVEEDGTPAFKEEDRASLKQQDAIFLGELTAAVIRANTVQAEDAEKNSQASL